MPPAPSLRFYIDPRTGQPHIYNHSVTEEEVQDVLDCPVEDRRGADGVRIAVGQTQSGRYLRVVYVRDPSPGSLFVITAYGLGAQVVRALGRRLRRKR